MAARPVTVHWIHGLNHSSLVSKFVCFCPDRLTRGKQRQKFVLQLLGKTKVSCLAKIPPDAEVCHNAMWAWMEADNQRPEEKT